MADRNAGEQYSLSYTSIGARPLETVQVVRAYLEQPDWAEVQRQIVEDNLIDLNAVGTRKRVGLEIVKRLKRLSDEELAFLARAVDDDRLAMLWVTICRTYPILHAFSTEVVAARYAGMAPDVPRTTWSAFVDEEAFDHPELTRLSEKSRKQLEIRTFGMLRECKLIDKAYVITPLYPSTSFVALMRASAPQDLEIFPKVGALL